MTRNLLTGANLFGPLQLNGAAGTSGQVLTSAGAGAIPTWSAAGGFTGGTLTSNLTVAAGTTSLSPLTFQSGTNLTSATAGAVEFDGKVLYSTPVGRGVSPSMMIYRLNSDLAGSNVNTAQSMLGVGVTLAASTVYAFEYNFALSKSAGTTSHSVGLSFGGTATLNNIYYAGVGTSVIGSLSIYTTAPNFIAVITASNFTASPTATTAGRVIPYAISGTVSINAGGTFIPQYTLSAAPGGAYTTAAGSYFAIWPIGAAGANTSVGPWA
jgi:hypothetical protein